eukprot:CAMPEP_0174371610 /NCGR_PEP_ID=MMETSP0811_2-20130205/100403_1 /TAXON_ID=73025 ORGANISM="Eutreptiella gymnastica-like, Strain CCMP1594" /NCGR_SAMPLE_ID=MMETSP0811_2 /ASSEMBLY_ACC=CAM_ASM_000667 /LENGTH=37 /DNA_ID= /DNA_START= /DNA_END= /DNA_ORIENTATION=
MACSAHQVLGHPEDGSKADAEMLDEPQAAQFAMGRGW